MVMSTKNDVRMTQDLPTRFAVAAGAGARQRGRSAGQRLFSSCEPDRQEIGPRCLRRHIVMFQ